MQAGWIEAVKRGSDANRAEWNGLTDKQRAGLIALEALRMMVKGEGGDPIALARGDLHAARIDGY